MEKTRQLVDTIVAGIQEKKGRGITIIDLRGLEGAICQYFVVCTGQSPTQVDAIADEVEEYVRINAKDKPVKIIGKENSQWVAMDYVDVMVHVFLPDVREYYNIENLWEDAKIEQIADLD